MHGAYGICPGVTFGADKPVEVWNEHLSLLVGRYVSTKVIRVRNKNKLWFDDQNLAVPQDFCSPYIVPLE